MSEHVFIELGPKAQPLTGQTFGRITVLGPVGRTADNRYVIYLCQCSCGTLKEIRGCNLRYGHTRSCGCLSLELLSERARVHGRCTEGAYQSWRKMKYRCRNSDDPAYPRYGGRGIDYCDAWESFEQFYADMGDRPAGTSIERIDNSKGYYKENCCWATRYAQSNNRRNNILVDFQGSQMTLSQAAKLAGVSYKLAHKRMKKGWSLEDALFKPHMKNQFG